MNEEQGANLVDHEATPFEEQKQALIQAVEAAEQGQPFCVLHGNFAGAPIGRDGDVTLKIEVPRSELGALAGSLDDLVDAALHVVLVREPLE